jgi:hypothetical protein
MPISVIRSSSLIFFTPFVLTDPARLSLLIIRLEDVLMVIKPWTCLSLARVYVLFSMYRDLGLDIYRVMV